jgi:hypothetical protein
MALIKCKECGNEISDKAKSYPKCGASRVDAVGVVSPIALRVGGVFCILFGVADLFNYGQIKQAT